MRSRSSRERDSREGIFGIVVQEAGRVVDFGVGTREEDMTWGMDVDLN